MPATFRVLQISDLHLYDRANVIHSRDARKAAQSDAFASLDNVQRDLLLRHQSRYEVVKLRFGSYNDAILLSATAHVVKQRSIYDVLLISGDLCSRGDSQYIGIGRDYLHAPASREYITLGKMPTVSEVGTDKIFILPGNHDRYRGPFGYPRNTIFDRELKEFWDAEETKQVDFCEVGPKDGFHLILIGADLTLRERGDCSGNVMNYLGQGRVYPNIVEQLEEQTKIVRTLYPKSFVIWISHFNPETVLHELSLNAAHLLIEASYRSNVEIILASHLHETTFKQYDNGDTNQKLYCFGSGSVCSTAVVDGHWLYLIDVDIGDNGRATILRNSYQLKYDKMSFELVKRERIKDLFAFHPIS